MAIRENKVHVFGATWAIRLGPDLPGRVVVRAAAVPLVPLLNPHRSLPPPVAGDHVQVGRNWAKIEPGSMVPTWQGPRKQRHFLRILPSTEDSRHGWKILIRKTKGMKIGIKNRELGLG